MIVFQEHDDAERAYISVYGSFNISQMITPSSFDFTSYFNAHRFFFAWFYGNHAPSIYFMRGVFISFPLRKNYTQFRQSTPLYLQKSMVEKV